MTPQTSRSKTNLLKMLFTRQNAELIIDMPPNECVKRLETLSRFDRKLKITALDETHGYDFSIDIRRNFKGDYTSAKYVGFIVPKDEPGKSFVWYEHRAGLFQRYFVILFAFSSLSLLQLFVNTLNLSLTSIALTGLALLATYIFLRQVKEDYRFGTRISEVLQAVPSPDTK